MKVTAVIAASIISLAAAAPGNVGCQPGTYACTTDPKTGGPGWKVCNTRAVWEFAGDCPPKTVCKFNPKNKSPYCVAPNFPIAQGYQQ